MAANKAASVTPPRTEEVGRQRRKGQREFSQFAARIYLPCIEAFTPEVDSGALLSIDWKFSKPTGVLSSLRVPCTNSS